MQPKDMHPKIDWSKPIKDAADRQYRIDYVEWSLFNNPILTQGYPEVRQKTLDQLQRLRDGSEY